MRSFLIQLTKLLSFFLVAHFVIITLSLLVIKQINKPSYLLNKNKLNEGSKIYIMGNSHPECGINDSLLPLNYINICQSGEPLFYTVIKARKLLKENQKIDTIIIEFTNNSLSTVNWVLNDNRLFRNYKRYFSDMKFEEHSFLLTNNFKKSLKTIFSLSPRKLWLNTQTVLGGFYHLSKNDISSKKFTQIPQFKIQSEQINYSKSQEFKGFINLIFLIKTNPEIEFILTRMPQHISYAGFNNEIEYQHCIAQLKSLNNCRYIDFTHTHLDNHCFGDAEHLNFVGAGVFTPIFLDSLKVKTYKFD